MRDENEKLSDVELKEEVLRLETLTVEMIKTCCNHTGETMNQFILRALESDVLGEGQVDDSVKELLFGR